MITSNEITELAKRFQKQCHESVEYSIGQNDKINYQDAVNSWLFFRLATLDLMIRDGLKEVIKATHDN